MTFLKDLKESYKVPGLHPPQFVLDDLAYLTYTGSLVYGVNNDMSDRDLVGFVVPPEEIMFPQYHGIMPGFDKDYAPFEQWVQNKVTDHDGVIWDFTVYNIVKFFRLTLDGNPNMLDTLFTHDRFVVEANKVGKHVRENRKHFVNLKCYDRFVGYAKSQLPRVGNPNKLENPKRMDSFVKYGYDTKAVYHLFRLLLECKDLLAYGEMNLEANADFLKRIRAGEFSVQKINDLLQVHLDELQVAKDASKLPLEGDEKRVKRVLMECLEMTYGYVLGGK